MGKPPVSAPSMRGIVIFIAVSVEPIDSLITELGGWWGISTINVSEEDSSLNSLQPISFCDLTRAMI